MAIQYGLPVLPVNPGQPVSPPAPATTPPTAASPLDSVTLETPVERVTQQVLSTQSIKEAIIALSTAMREWVDKGCGCYEWLFIFKGVQVTGYGGCDPASTAAAASALQSEILAILAATRELPGVAKGMHGGVGSSSGLIGENCTEFCVKLVQKAHPTVAVAGTISTSSGGTAQIVFTLQFDITLIAEMRKGTPVGQLPLWYALPSKLQGPILPGHPQPGSSKTDQRSSMLVTPRDATIESTLVSLSPQMGLPRRMLPLRLQSATVPIESAQTTDTGSCPGCASNRPTTPW